MLISSKRLNATGFKFDRHVPGYSGHEPLKFFQKGAWPVSRDPLNFWALNANNSKTVRAIDFKFACIDPGTDRTWPLKNFSKRGVARSRDPLVLGHACWPHPHSAPDGHKVGVVSSRDQICNITLPFAMFNDRPFKFYTQLKREEYSDSYTHNSRRDPVTRTDLRLYT